MAEAPCDVKSVVRHMEALVLSRMAEAPCDVKSVVRHMEALVLFRMAEAPCDVKSVVRHMEALDHLHRTSIVSGVETFPLMACIKSFTNKGLARYIYSIQDKSSIQHSGTFQVVLQHAE